MTASQQQPAFGRRGFLKAGGMLGAAGVLSALMGNAALAAEGRGRGVDTMHAPNNGGYGPLQPAPAASCSFRPGSPTWPSVRPAPR